MAELVRWRDRCIRMVSVCPDAFLEVDASGLLIEWNPRAESLFGWTRDEVIGRPAHETVLSRIQPGTSPGDGSTGGVANGADQLPDGARRQLRLVHRTGAPVAVEARVFTTGYGPTRCVSAFVRSIDGPDRAADRHAEPSGMCERPAFVDALDRRLAGPGVEPGSVAVVLLDLDHFRAVNSAIGHDAGDLVLASVAERLVHRSGHADLVATFGGDVFAAMFAARAGHAHRRAQAFVSQARTLLREPVPAAGSEVCLDVSAGIALNTFGVSGAAEMLQNAEAAMYRAKRRGGGSAETFREPMRIEALDRMTTESSLRGAVGHDELLLHYQPVVELGGASTVGVEALVRWRHPQQGLIAASRFVPVAEESGLIVPIGEWVLHEACDQLRRWQGRRDRGGRGCVEVNISARQVADARIVDTVHQVLSRTGLPAEHLVLEITESALMADIGSSVQVLGALKQMGVQLAIDDFGTGYSSLSYLQRFPVDVLKVDRSFVEQLGVRAEADTIVASVIGLAHGLGLKVVAEGVETVGQLEVLRSLGCDLAQGFLFSVPRPASEIVAPFPLPVSA